MLHWATLALRRPSITLSLHPWESRGSYRVGILSMTRSGSMLAPLHPLSHAPGFPVLEHTCTHRHMALALPAPAQPLPTFLLGTSCFLRPSAASFFHPTHPGLMHTQAFCSHLGAQH